MCVDGHSSEQKKVHRMSGGTCTQNKSATLEEPNAPLHETNSSLGTGDLEDTRLHKGNSMPSLR